MVIVAARGITGGISIGVTNFVTALGSSVPPGIWAMARSIQPVCVATYQATVVAPVSLRKLRRVGMVPPPVGTAVAGRRARRSWKHEDVSSSMGLGIQAKAREPPGSVGLQNHQPGGGPRAAG